jgi:hypothetical protein
LHPRDWNAKSKGNIRVGATYNDGRKRAIGTGAEEERAMATMIVSAKAMEWQHYQRWRESKGNGIGKSSIDSNGNGSSHKDSIVDGDCEGDST